MRVMRLSFKEAMIGLCVGFVIAYLAHEFGWNKKSDGMEELNRAFGDPPIDYYGAAEPPVRWWRSHLSGLSEPPRLTAGYLAFSGSNP